MSRLPFRADGAVDGAEGELAWRVVGVAGDSLALRDIAWDSLFEACSSVLESHCAIEVEVVDCCVTSACRAV